ncbi:Galactosyltransferase, related, related [Eimeria tenella]|uniref:Galactosyltransferase, related, related n=1 Tax=Eimeria tenella TaxID=5802 RepID=U6KRA5_EIMTE|nr:Galactosyltransferase, related, related [Eimeria tenella]CDJ40491.1 Galactosyltransferase, related, related [Eimeria tenella]|eukprot:XP_013231241.1 Galactosyltransferase, related, related [Eimeria tenella]
MATHEPTWKAAARGPPEAPPPSPVTGLDPKKEAAVRLLRELQQQTQGPHWGAFAVGWGLTDPQPTIIHHFAAAQSQVYPHLDAGTLWSRPAFEAVKKAYTEEPPPEGVERDFIYEMSVHLKNTQQLQLLHSELFCPVPPAVDNYERDLQPYPPNHVRPTKVAGAEAAAAANKRQLSAAERAAVAAADITAIIHKDCAAFNSGNRHGPILSHQIFDALIDFDEDLMIKRDFLSEKFTAEEKMVDGGKYQKALEELEKSRPAFIVEPQDVMVAVKTHAGSHASRVPLLRRLWASREVLLEQAKRHLGAEHYAHLQMNKEELKQLTEAYDTLSIRFFSDIADPSLDIEVLDLPGNPAPEGKRGLCVRLQALLKEFLAAPVGRRFLVVTDDDTLLNFRHLLDLLSLTLQPPIPARSFLANLLADGQGYRAYTPPYKRLAEEIRAHLQRRAAAAAAAADPVAAATPAKDSRYTPEQLTAASHLYGRGGPRPLEAVSPLYLGERYGYGLSGGSGAGGYEYVTMGGGMVVDRAAAALLVECVDSGRCSCPEDGTADDMLLGLWAHRVQLPLLHARGMHQERPADYHPLLVEATTPVSFHRMLQSVKGTKKIFDDYVDVGDYSNNQSSNGSSSSSKSGGLDELIEVDWIDYDWHHAEEHRWLEKEELHELDQEEPLLPDGIGDLLNRKVKRGTRPMTPEELLEHEELEEMNSLHDEL